MQPTACPAGTRATIWGAGDPRDYAPCNTANHFYR
jgi:hypothetical protein